LKKDKTERSKSKKKQRSSSSKAKIFTPISQNEMKNRYGRKLTKKNRNIADESRGVMSNPFPVNIVTT
jgi:hypothetical protein